MRDCFKSSFEGIVRDISLFSTHSLRAGGALAAANAGVSERLFRDTDIGNLFPLKIAMLTIVWVHVCQCQVWYLIVVFT